MILFLIFLLGFVLRLININQSLWLDEAITALAVKNNSYLDLIFKFAPGDFHPPLYYLLLKLWTDIFGYSEIALRFPSILFSVGIGFFIYLIAKKIANKKIAVIAAFLWMINPLSIYYAQEARMYSLATFGVAGAMYFFLEKKWLWYFVFFLIALGADYLPILMLPVFFLLSDNKKKFVLLNLLLLIPFFIWLPIFYQHIQNGVSASSSSWAAVLGQFDLKALPLTFVKFITGRIPAEIWMLPILLVYLFALVRAKSKALWFWLLIPILLGFLISAVMPIYSYFRFMFVLPAFVMLLAIGTKGKYWLVILFTIVSLGSLIIFNLNSDIQRENWRDATKYMQENPGLIVMPNKAQSAPLEYYGNNLPLVDSMPLALFSVDKEGNVGGSSFLTTYPNSPKTIYLIRYVREIFDPADKAKNNIENANYKKVEEKGFNGVLIWKYRQF